MRYQLSYSEDSLVIAATTNLNMMAALLAATVTQRGKRLRLVCQTEGDMIAAQDNVEVQKWIDDLRRSS